jgi:hypothetical protein
LFSVKSATTLTIDSEFNLSPDPLKGSFGSISQNHDAISFYNLPAKHIDKQKESFVEFAAPFMLS